MVQIDFLEAKKFLENVSKNDKVGIITHDDLDGMASGVLFYDYCKQKGCKDIKHFSFTLGKTKVSKLNLEDRTKLLVADLGQNLLYPDLNNVKLPVLYTDHHISENLKFGQHVFEYRTSSEGYFPSSRTVFELCGGKAATSSLHVPLRGKSVAPSCEKDWLSLIGVLSDFGDKYPENKEFVESISKKYDRSVSEFAREFVYPAANFLVYFEDDLERAFNFLTKVKDLKHFSRVNKFSKVIEREIERVEKDFRKHSEKFGKTHFYMLDSPYNIKTSFINRISSTNPQGVYVLGYKYENQIGISARNQANLYNMRELLKDCTLGFEGVSSGGHSAAAGAKIDVSQLEAFKQNLMNYRLKNSEREYAEKK